MARSRKCQKHSLKWVPLSARTVSTFSTVSLGIRRYHYRSGKLRYFGPHKTSSSSSPAVATLSGVYDPGLVNTALFRVVARKHSNSIPPDVLQALEEHFEANPNKVAALADSIYSFYFSKQKQVHTSNTVPYVVVNMFRTYFNSVPDLAGSDPFQLTFSSVSQSNTLTSALPLVELLVDFGQKRNTCMDLYCKGVGTVLPELKTLTMEFDFGTLRNISPVLNKISCLASEFDAFNDLNGDIHRFDANALRLFVNVLRYQRLYRTLISRSSDGSLAQDLLAISKDKDAGNIQTELSTLCGEQGEIDNLVFSVHRNFFNAIYVSTGLVNFDRIFAFVNREAENECYSSTEKKMMRDFVDTFLPLVCNGLLQLDALNQVKYACLPARHEDDIIVPFKFSNNMFDNYEISLAILFRVPSRLHLIRLVKSVNFNSSDSPSLDKLVAAIREHFSNSSSLLKADSQELVRILTEMDHFVLRGTKILKILILDPSLNRVAENQSLLCRTVDSMQPSIKDLSEQIENENKGSSTKTAKSIRINNHEITDYRTELNSFRLIDLNNETFVDIGIKSLLRYLEERMRYIAMGKHSAEPSAVNTENIEQFLQLYEILAASYDVGIPLEFQLDIIADEGLKAQETKATSPQYVQIPDDLKLHDLHSELEIFRTDELKCPYASLSLDQILDRLKSRVDALVKENPVVLKHSRMTPENVLWFKKLLSRLKLLFSMNGGNTQVLDALIQSQDVFSQLESKIKSKKSQPAEETADAGKESDTYLQIPEELHLHDYISELVEFKEKDLCSDYKDCSPENIILILKKRTEEIIKSEPSSNAQLAILRDNFRTFAVLLSRLNKLFILNGGYTAILDTLIQSQSVFEKFESGLAKRLLVAADQHKNEIIYSQIPEDMNLEEYYEELSELKSKIGSSFGSVDVKTILRTLESMIDEETELEKKVIFRKLKLNLMNLFKLNNSHAFVLDNVLLSAENFARVEKELGNVAATENVFEMSSFLNDNKDLDKSQDDYVLSLLVNKEKKASNTESTIESALRSAMDPKPNAYIEEEDTYTKEPETKTSTIETINASEKRDPVDKETLEKFLKKAKSDNETKLERQWRERKAYEWSSGMVNGRGTLESRTFFDSWFGRASSFPMFPHARKRDHDFLVLTSNGDTFKSVENPLGSSHIPEDMFDILERLSEYELAKFSKRLKKLQKQHWKLIGGGGKGDKQLLVLRRSLGHRSPTLWSRAKSLLGAVMIVFFTLIGLNYWLETKAQEEEKSRSSSESSSENAKLNSTGVFKDTAVDTSENEAKGDEKPTLWKQLLWR